MGREPEVVVVCGHRGEGACGVLGVGKYRVESQLLFLGDKVRAGGHVAGVEVGRDDAGVPCADVLVGGSRRYYAAVDSVVVVVVVFGLLLGLLVGGRVEHEGGQRAGHDA